MLEPKSSNILKCTAATGRLCGTKHSSLGYKSPEQFEDKYYTKLANLVYR